MKRPDFRQEMIELLKFQVEAILADPFGCDFAVVGDPRRIVKLLYEYTAP